MNTAVRIVAFVAEFYVAQGVTFFLVFFLVSKFLKRKGYEVEVSVNGGNAGLLKACALAGIAWPLVVLYAIGLLKRKES